MYPAQDNSLARSSIEAFIDYGNGLASERSKILCSQHCLNGVFLGNIDVRNAYTRTGTFKLTIIIHGYINDKVRLNNVSLGDLILASEIKPGSKGMV